MKNQLKRILMPKRVHKSELVAAYEEWKQRKQDFEFAEPDFIEAAIYYLRAAERKLDTVLNQKIQGKGVAICFSDGSNREKETSVLNGFVSKLN